MRVSWNDFSSGWEYIANEFVDKRDTEEHVDGQVSDDTKPPSDSEARKTDVKYYLSFGEQRLFDGCPYFR